MRLALEIVSIFYNETNAMQAQSAFIQLFQKGGLPDEMPDYTLKNGDTVLDVLVKANLVTSKNEGRRLLQQKGVRLDGELIENGQSEFGHPGVLQVGKRKFIRLIN